jgi:hypothetical protein
LPVIFLKAKTNRMLKNAFLLFFTTIALDAYTQDANYWSSNYGVGGFLAPGATIAKNGDSGVLFYNPALLAYNTKNAASISGNFYNIRSTNIKDGAGAGLNLTSTNASVIPFIAANTIYLKLKSPITFAYALINNPVMTFEASQRKDGQQNVLEDSYSPGDELFVGQYVLSNNIHETTGLLAFAKPLSQKLAVGVSLGLNMRKQTYLTDLKSKTLINDTGSLDQKLVTTTEYYRVNNLTVGLGVKFGLSYDLSPQHHIGLMASLPMMHLYGKGDLLTDFSVTNLQLNATELFLFASGKQTKLKARWKTPISVAAGYTYDYRKGQIYFAVEYFDKVKQYNVVQPRNEKFIRPDTGNISGFTSQLLRLKDQHKTIINFAVGTSFLIKDELRGYCSLRTNFNYLSSDLFTNFEGYRSGIGIWDMYHMQIGANFKKRKFNLRSGILLSYGSSGKYMQDVNFDNPNENNYLGGDPHTTRATEVSAGLMFAYIYNF